MNGIINIIKPSGLTSSDVVVRLKRIFGTRRVGHFGTLDPLGAGVLLVGINSGTKLFDYFLNKSKEYYAVFRFGVETDTLDSSGVVTSISETIPSIDDIKNALSGIVGEIDQLPPMYSAKNVNGVRAYQLARRGIEVVLTPKRVSIYSVKLLRQIDDRTFSFLINCSGGTYIRSIARDLAYLLNTKAIMTEIIRTKAGRFCIDEGLTIEEITEIKEKSLITLEAAIDLPELVIDDAHFKKIHSGVPVYADVTDGSYKLYCDDKFFGICGVKDNIVKNEVWLYEDNSI